jgi:hypothetical protein
VNRIVWFDSNDACGAETRQIAVDQKRKIAGEVGIEYTGFIASYGFNL